MTRAMKILIAVFVAFALINVLLLVTASTADAHTPNPRACQLAWEQAPAGEKWAARVRCERMQRRHVAWHQQERRIAAARAACLRMRSGMGSGMCDAIARVRPAWGTNSAYHELLRRESGWSTNAVNERSGACGSFQRLPCPWRYYGGSSRPDDDRVYSTPLQQTKNGVRYIAGRYGSPERAIVHHNARGWY